MDFLLLLPNRARVVIECDGAQHYADDLGRASPQRYAEMVAEDPGSRNIGTGIGASDDLGLEPWGYRSADTWIRMLAQNRHVGDSLGENGAVTGWGLVDDPGSLFGPTIVRWYPIVQWFDGDGFADLLRSQSLYRKLDRDVREPLLDAIAERIRTRMGNRVARRYLSVLRIGQRTD
jgi:hypothetical protein